MLKPFLCNIHYYNDLWPGGAGDEPFKLITNNNRETENWSLQEQKKEEAIFVRLDFAIWIGVWSCVGGFELTFWEDRISCFCMEICN